MPPVLNGEPQNTGGQYLGVRVGRQYRYDNPDEKPSVVHQTVWRGSQISLATGVAIHGLRTPVYDKTFAIRLGIAAAYLGYQEWHVRRKMAKEAKERAMTAYSTANIAIGTAYGVANQQNP